MPSLHGRPDHAGSPPAPGALRWLPTALVVGGGAAVVVGVVGANLLAPLGLGTVAAGVILARRAPRGGPEQLGGHPDPFLRRMRKVLVAGGDHPTVPALVARTGWPESTVRRVLAIMAQRGQVDEKVDPATGDRCYAPHEEPQGITLLRG